MIYPIYQNGQAVESLPNTTTVTLQQGILRILTLNNLGAEEQVFEHHIVDDFNALGPVFRHYGVDMETRIFTALHESTLWKQAKAFQRYIGSRRNDISQQFVICLPGCALTDVCSVTIALDFPRLLEIVNLIYEERRAQTENATLLALLIEKNPLNLCCDINPVIQVGPRQVFGKPAVYHLLMDIL